MKLCKICMIGDFAVGKTSLVSRYVHSSFGEKYLTTVGVKVDTKILALPSGDRLKLVLWDISGKSAFARVDTSYLKGASGYMLVVDTTRHETLHSAMDLQASVEELLGVVPFNLLLNKIDLNQQWALSADILTGLQSRGWSVIRTSALNGDGVEGAFAQLGERLLHQP